MKKFYLETPKDKLINFLERFPSTITHYEKCGGRELNIVFLWIFKRTYLGQHTTWNKKYNLERPSMMFERILEKLNK